MIFSWYYFDSKGRMVRSNSKPIKIDAMPKESGSYFFDEDGHMLSGWLEIEDDDGDINTYYLGEGDDGKMRTEWQFLETREDTEPENKGTSYDSNVWYYFDWSGEQIKDQEKKINYNYYQFDSNGVMVTGWYPGVATPDPDWSGINRYYDPETGARKTGWVYAHEPTDIDNTEEQYWYYLNKKGEVFNDGGSAADEYLEEAEIAIKRIGNQRYGFDGLGRMLVGFVDTRADRPEDNEEIDPG